MDCVFLRVLHGEAGVSDVDGLERMRMESNEWLWTYRVVAKLELDSGKGIECVEGL